jgi:hypothetical protein
MICRRSGVFRGAAGTSAIQRPSFKPAVTPSLRQAHLDTALHGTGWRRPRRRSEAFSMATRTSPPQTHSPYPGGMQAGSPGSRSAPRVHVGKGNNPGGVEESAAFAPLPGCGFHHDAPFPGCVLRTTRSHRLPSLRGALTPEAWDQATLVALLNPSVPGRPVHHFGEHHHGRPLRQRDRGHIGPPLQILTALEDSGRP